MFNFPTEKANSERRQKWIRLVNRADPDKTYCLKQPGPKNRICSRHFVDGKPIPEHPDPELLMGTGNKLPQMTARKGHTIRATTSGSDEPSQDVNSDLVNTDECHILTSNVCSVASLMVILLYLCYYIADLKVKYKKLLCENYALKAQNCIQKSKIKNSTSKSTTQQNLLKNDSNVLFYTGLETKAVFELLHQFISPFLRHKWRGLSCTRINKSRIFSRSPKKFGPQQKLTTKDEFLLTLMKLRLGLLNQDLSGRFGISPAQCSRIFQTWLTVMKKALVSLVFWPSKEQVQTTEPQSLS